MFDAFIKTLHDRQVGIEIGCIRRRVFQRRVIQNCKKNVSS